MNKIILLTNEISINGVYHPFNKIYFKPGINSTIQIYNTGGDLLVQGSYLDFRNENNQLYSSVDSVIEALRESFS